MSKESAVLKLGLEVTTENAIEMDGQSRICNWLYNHLLEEANRLKTEFIKSRSDQTSLTLYSKRGLRNLLPDLKKKKSFFKGCAFISFEKCSLET
jgi:putative transposase